MTGTARTCFWLPKSTIVYERVCPILMAYSSQTYPETKPQDRADAVNRERPGPPEDWILISVVARTTFLFSRSISRPTKRQRIPSSSPTTESLIIYCSLRHLRWTKQACHRFNQSKFMTSLSIRHPNSPTAVEQLSTPMDVVSDRIEFDKGVKRWSRTPVGF